MRHNREAMLQELLTRWLEGQGVLYVASMVGVNLGPRVGAIRKRMGIKKGVPDLLILEPRGKHHGMCLELKVKGGSATSEQIEFVELAGKRGYYAVIMPCSFEIQEALEWAQREIEWYLAGNSAC